MKITDKKEILMDELTGWWWDPSRKCFHREGYWMLPGTLVTKIDTLISAFRAERKRGRRI